MDVVRSPAQEVGTTQVELHMAFLEIQGQAERLVDPLAGRISGPGEEESSTEKGEAAGIEVVEVDVVERKSLDLSVESESLVDESRSANVFIV